jgi:hypothetical protein
MNCGLDGEKGGLRAVSKVAVTGHAPVVRRTLGKGLLGCTAFWNACSCCARLLIALLATLRHIRRNLAIKVTRLSQPSEIRL